MTITLESIGGERPWVARITGTDSKFGLAREFVRGVVDYSHANSVCSRGVKTTYALAAGTYQINDPQTWKRTARYFVAVAADGTVTHPTLDQVLASFASQEVAA